MKSPGVIYRRYRQIKKKILYEKIQDALKKEHCNCVYGKCLRVSNKDVTHSVPVCLYGIKERQFEADVCTNPGECNAFARKYTKNAIEEVFLSELKDPAIRYRKYPELHVLDWVLDKQLTEAEKTPNILTRVLVFLIVLLENLVKLTSKTQKNLSEN